MLYTFNMEIYMDWDEKTFLKTYKGTETFVNVERGYYDLFLDLLHDEKLLSHIRFANDALHVPPLKTFILYERDFLNKDVFREKMSGIAKRGMGACFGYLYKFLYGGYESEPCWFNDALTGIKTASYFKKP